MRSRSNERLLALVGCIRGIVLEFDGDARYVNAWTDDPALLAAPPAELVGKTVDEVLGAAIGAPLTAAVVRVFRTGARESMEYPLDVAGVRRWFFADFKRIGDESDRVTVVVFARDITDRKEVEDALARSEERYRLAARATNDVLWDWDIASGRVVWGPNAAPVLGYDEEVPEQIAWWKERVHPDDADEIGGTLAEALAGAASWSGRYRFRRADGTYSDVFDRGLIVRDAAGAAVRMVGSMSDVTQLRRLQAQLLSADRLAALGLLAAGVGHEINNPLTYVIHNLAVAIEELDTGRLSGAQAVVDDVRVALGEAHDGANRIAEIVRTLKLFSRADESKARAVDVHAVLERAIKMAENEIRHRATLVRFFERIPQVRASESQLGQVFLNLLINAAQAIEEGNKARNEVRVTTGVDAGGRPFVAFSDTGCGIDPEQLPRVFDPFFTTKPVGTGTGLGLSICHNIVEKIGGSLTVESTLGRGTTFTVHLDAFAAVPAAPAGEEDDGSISDGGSPRVLVLDDEAPIGRIVKRMLRDEAEVVTLTTARDALARIVSGRDRFEFILCDLMMPDMSGMDFFEALRATRPDLVGRVAFMTGGVFTARASEFLERSRVPCLEKPLERERVRALLRAVLAPPPPSSPEG